jgi:hypothetical protein
MKQFIVFLISFTLFFAAQARYEAVIVPERVVEGVYLPDGVLVLYSDSSQYGFSREVVRLMRNLSSNEALLIGSTRNHRWNEFINQLPSGIDVYSLKRSPYQNGGGDYIPHVPPPPPMLPPSGFPGGGPGFPPPPPIGGFPRPPFG